MKRKAAEKIRFHGAHGGIRTSADLLRELREGTFRNYRRITLAPSYDPENRDDMTFGGPLMLNPRPTTGENLSLGTPERWAGRWRGR